MATTRGWLSLAVVLDVYSRLVVGWSLSENNDEELVENALRMALLRQRPKPGLVHHSDRGSQYTSRAYQRLAEQSGMLMSMSRNWDNAAMESLFGTLKEEGVGTIIYQSHEEARQALFIYMEIFYHRIRRHSTLGYVSPLTSEQRSKQNVEAKV